MQVLKEIVLVNNLLTESQFECCRSVIKNGWTFFICACVCVLVCASVVEAGSGWPTLPVTVDLVHTLALVLTGIRRAFIGVRLTPASFKAWKTDEEKQRAVRLQHVLKTPGRMITKVPGNAVLIEPPAPAACLLFRLRARRFPSESV